MTGIAFRLRRTDSTGRWMAEAMIGRDRAEFLTAGQIVPPPPLIVLERLDFEFLMLHLAADLQIGIEVGQIRLGQFPLLVLAPHLAVQLFQPPHQQRHVEQDAMVASGLELLAQGLEQLGMIAQLDGTVDKILRRLADQFGQAGSAHQAAAHPRRKRAAAQGQHGHPHPERIRSGGVRPVRRGIQKQVGQRIARQVKGIGNFRGKNQSFGRDAALRRLPGDVVLSLDPGMAFGTGLHPTTRLCLAALETLADEGLLTQGTGKGGAARVIDVGCGSGILAIAAGKLGAGELLGVDTDPIAVEATTANARLNGQSRRLRVRQGSVPSGEGLFDIVLANLIASLLVALAEPLRGELRPGGRILASGIFRDREDDVRTAFEAAGLRLSRRWAEEDWVALEAIAE